VEDVVAVKLRDRKRGDWAVVTWGRVYDPVDEKPLLDALRRVAPRMGFPDLEQLEVCYHLGEVREYQYFHEALLDFAVRMAKEPYETDAWKQAQRSDDALKRSVYLLQRPGYRNEA
jgi:hypothetical protein